MSDISRTDRLHFAEFDFDPASGELRRDGFRVPLRPQAATVLELLLRNAGDLVTRDRLQEALWGDTVVDAEAGLNHCVRQVRLALGESASAPRLLVTEPRRGYRLRARVERRSRTAPRWRASTGGRIARAAAALLLVAALAAAPWLISGDAGAPAEPAAARSAAYLRARWLLEQPGADRARRAIPLLESVLGNAPDFAGGHAALARALAFASSNEGLEQARVHADRALRLQPDLPEALVMRSFIRTFAGRDYAGAEADLRRALARAPDEVDARHHLAALLSMQGRHDEAIAHMRTALRTDPVSPLLAGDLAWFYFVAGRWREAVDWADRTLELDPEWSPAHSVKLHATARLGDDRALRDLAATALLREGATTEAAAAVASAGDPLRDYWSWWSRTLDGDDPALRVSRAMTHAALGRPGQALDELETALADGDRRVPMLIRDPRLGPLRSEPRFRRLLERLGLEPDQRGAHTA